MRTYPILIGSVLASLRIDMVQNPTPLGREYEPYGNARYVRAVRLRGLILYLEIDHGHPDVSVPIAKVDSLVILQDDAAR